MTNLLSSVLVLGAIVVLAQCEVQQTKVETTEKKGPLGLMTTGKETHVEEKNVEHRMRRDQPRKDKFVELTQFERDRLIKSKDEQLLFRKIVKSYEQCPVTQQDRLCFAKFQSGQSIDFVIDLAPSPSLDKFDKISANSPVAQFWERVVREPSRAYFSAIQLFIDVVTLEIKPEFTHSIIYDSKEHVKYFLRGRSCEKDDNVDKMRQGGLFEDKSRNLNTLWPHCSKQINSDLFPLVKNNLGRMTKLALWNRDNGLPTVFASSRQSKPMYTIVLSDGSSGASINDLTDDLSRTTVIDIGNRRFVDKIDWNQYRDIAGIFVLTAPQQLSIMADTVRNLACRFVENPELAQ